MFLALLKCLSAQYSAFPPDSLNEQNFTRAEIRTYLLMMNEEDSEVYHLARKSKRKRNLAYIFYGLSIVYAAVSIEAISSINRNEDDPWNLDPLAAWGGGAGAVLFASFGILSTHNSRKNLRKAAELYRQQAY